MRLERAEFQILQQLRSIPLFRASPACDVHLLFSGGKDSTALFQLLLKIQSCPKEWSQVSFSLFIHHFNHRRRGEESDDDERHCIDLALHSGCPLKVWRWSAEMDGQIEKGANFQALARQWRYDSVEKFAERVSSKNKQTPWVISTAHHRRDHAETILHNITRGCGISGLSGVLPWSSKQRRLRPLLWLPTDVCDAYIKEKSWPHRDDSSNFQVDYTRNRIRHIVLNELEKINEKAVEHIWNLSGDLQEANRKAAYPALADIEPAGQRHMIAIGDIRSEDDLHRFIAKNNSTGQLNVTRESLANVLRHINKCRNSPSVPRQYIFALSDMVCLKLNHKLLEIKVTQPEFPECTSSLRREL